jgi:hypothetical protein
VEVKKDACGVEYLTQSQALTPTPCQQLQLQLAQKDAIARQLAARIVQLEQDVAEQTYHRKAAEAKQAQGDAQQAIKALSDAAAALMKERGWPANTEFKLDTLLFVPAPGPGPAPNNKDAAPGSASPAKSDQASPPPTKKERKQQKAKPSVPKKAGKGNP